MRLITSGDNKHELTMMVVIQAIYYFAIIGFTVFLMRTKNPRYFAALKLFGVAATCALNQYRDGTKSDAVYGFLATVNYDIIFMA